MSQQKDGRRNRYQIQAHLPLAEAASQEPAIGEVLVPGVEGHVRVIGPRVTGTEQLAGEDTAGASAWRIRAHRAGNFRGGQNGRLKPAWIR